MEVVLIEDEAIAVFEDVMTTMLMMTVGIFIISLGSSSSSSSSSIEDEGGRTQGYMISRRTEHWYVFFRRDASRFRLAKALDATRRNSTAGRKLDDRAKETAVEVKRRR
jgi:hypothetical protein